MSLVRQFVLAGSVIMAIVTVLAGMFIANLIRENVLFHRSVATALFMDNVVAVHLQALAHGPLPETDRAALDAVLNSPGVAERVPYLEVWLADGTIAYSKSNELHGIKLDLPPAAALAFEGEVEVAFADLAAPEHTMRDFQRSFLEIYSPLRLAGSGQIIAVMEFHENQDPIANTVMDATRWGWAVVASSFFALSLAIFFVVRGGARTIEKQKQDLAAQLAETRQLANHNDLLREQALHTAALNTELHEGLLRTIGSDLHDGPVQLLAYSSLKMESIRRAESEDRRVALLAEAEEKLREAMDDIRDIATGLILPDIETLNLSTVISEAIASHERHTKAQVQVTLRALPKTCSTPTKIGIYRFLQEGLTNAWNYGNQRPVQIIAEVRNNVLSIVVENATDHARTTPRRGHGLGLRALKVRVETIGGSLDLAVSTSKARLSLHLPLDKEVGR